MEQETPSPRVARANYLRMDDQGRIIPLTEEEKRARREAIREALKEIAAIPDDPNEDDEVFWRAMDESRPDRPLFRELYER